MNSETKTVGARWIVPVDRPPMKDASLTISKEGTIVELHPGGRVNADEDLGEVALTPRLINAHTHLEFSSLDKPLGNPGNPITDWIPQVIGWRTQQSESDIQGAIVDGIKQSVAHGVAGIGEIATIPWHSQVILPPDVSFRWFAERLGTDPVQCDSRIAEGKNWLGSRPAEQPDERIRFGISPHAPYSLCDELFHGLIDWAVSEQLPVAMHLAETRQELQWLQSGNGPFAVMFERIGVPATGTPGRSPRYYLEAMSKTSHALVVHGNYLDDSELDFIGQQNNMQLVYCPRTHSFFEHDEYPLTTALSKGICIAVGTDSKASNPDLCLLSELKWIHRVFPSIEPERVFEMGTQNGALALQLEDSLGSLTPGKRGGFLTIPMNGTADLWESILGSQSLCS